MHMHAQNSLAGVLKPGGYGVAGLPLQSLSVPKEASPFIAGGHAKLFFSVSAVALGRSGKSCPGGLGIFTGEGKVLYVLFLGLKNQEIGTSPAFVNILGKLLPFPVSS